MVEGGFEGKGEMKDNCREKGAGIWRQKDDEKIWCYSRTKRRAQTYNPFHTNSC